MFGSGLLTIIMRNLKYILPVVAGIILAFIVWRFIGNIKEEAYKDGVNTENKAWIAKIQKEDIRNREFEDKLSKIVATFGQKAVEEAINRSKTEVVYTERLKTIVNNNAIYEQCVVDKEALEQRNNIRALGPTGVTSTRNANGSIRVEFKDE